jgi:hypothetical protein
MNERSELRERDFVAPFPGNKHLRDLGRRGRIHLRRGKDSKNRGHLVKTPLAVTYFCPVIWTRPQGQSRSQALTRPGNSGTGPDYPQHIQCAESKLAQGPVLQYSFSALKAILKWPLIVAAAVTIIRVILERAGAPYPIPSLFSVVLLHTLLGPIYFAVHIGSSSVARAYAQQFKLVAIYVVLARAMILPTYWLARIYHWPENRFAGLWGPDVNAFAGFVGVPLVTALIWIVISIICGNALGAVIIAILRRLQKPAN